MTVRVTELAPIFAQVNVDGEAEKLEIPQLSVLPLSKLEATIVPFPVASNTTVPF